MTRDEFLPYMTLAAAIIHQAVSDLSYTVHDYDRPPRRRGQLGGARYHEHAREVRAEASEWLRGEVCGGWCEMLGVDHGAVVNRIMGEKPRFAPLKKPSYGVSGSRVADMGHKPYSRIVKGRKDRSK